MNESRVVTCFLEHRGGILLLKRSGQVGSYQQKWAGVSGYIEPGNNPLQQALQELNEETGLNAGDIQLLQSGEPLEIIDEGLAKKWIVYPFRFYVADASKIVIDWEHSEHRWIKPEQIKDYHTVPGLAMAWERVK